MLPKARFIAATQFIAELVARVAIKELLVWLWARISGD
jgi:hypothetical protein